MPSLRVLFDNFAEARAPKVEHADLSHLKRLDIFRRHGDFSLAYSTAVQKGLSYFGDAGGYIAFRTKMKHHFALGDPVADPGDHEALIARFVREAGDPWFVQIGQSTARTLSRMGYLVNRLGVDTRLELATHDFSGKRNETVRYSEKWLQRKGYAIVDDKGQTVVLDDIRLLSENWRSERIVSRWEMTFLNRPFEIIRGVDMRRFLLLDPGGHLVAILDFDPLFRDGKVVGYTTAFKRKAAGATPHAEVGMTKFAADRFREEGVPLVTLGLSPLLDIGPSGFAESGFWRGAFQTAYGSRFINRSRFNLQGQAAFKRRFHGMEEPVYVAFRKGTLMEMLGLLRLVKAV